MVNPINDTLNAHWLPSSKKKPPAEDKEPSGPAETYAEKDENWYLVREIYGDQGEERPRYRHGRRAE